MGLAALVHLDLELRMSGLELREQPVQGRRLVAREQRHDPARLLKQPLEHDARDLVERGSTRDRLLTGEPETSITALAKKIHTSEHTLRNHLTSIYNKLGLAGRLQLHIFASRHGLG